MAESYSIGEEDVMVVIDAQRDFCPGGALPVPNGDEVIGPINRLMSVFKHTVLSQDWHPEGHQSFASTHAGKQPMETVDAPYGEQILWPDHAVAGTEGAEFHPDLDTSKVELVVRKGFRPEIDSYSTFFENDRKTTSGLAGYLKQRGLKRVFLVGLATEYCVGFSALDGVAEGFEVFVISDATGSFGNEATEPMCEEMDRAGVKRIKSSDLS